MANRWALFTFVFVVVTLQVVTGYSQTATKKGPLVDKIVNRYWTPLRLVEQNDKDGFKYVVAPDRKSATASQRGFILRSDKTFEEVGTRGCAQSRGNYKGSWLIVNDTIKLTTNQNHEILMKVLYADSKELYIK